MASLQSPDKRHYKEKEHSNKKGRPFKKTVGRKLASLQSPKKESSAPGGKLAPCKALISNKKPKRQTATGGSAW